MSGIMMATRGRSAARVEYVNPVTTPRRSTRVPTSPDRLSPSPLASRVKRIPTPLKPAPKKAPPATPKPVSTPRPAVSTTRKTRKNPLRAHASDFFPSPIPEIPTTAAQDDSVRPPSPSQPPPGSPPTPPPPTATVPDDPARPPSPSQPPPTIPSPPPSPTPLPRGLPRRQHPVLEVQAPLPSEVPKLPEGTSFEKYLYLSRLPAYTKRIYQLNSVVFLSTVSRLADAWIRDPSRETLLDIMAFPKVGLFPAICNSTIDFQAHLTAYPSVDWPEPRVYAPRVGQSNKAIRRMVEAGRLSAATRSLTDDSQLAPDNEETLAELRLKHPQGPAAPFCHLE